MSLAPNSGVQNQPAPRETSGGPWRGFGPLRNLSTRLAFLAAIMIVVAVAAAAAVGYQISSIVTSQAQSIATDKLRNQARDYLVQVNDNVARQNDLILDRAVRDVSTVTAVASSLYAAPPTSTVPAEALVPLGPDGQRLNGPKAITSLFVPKTQPFDAGTQLDVTTTEPLAPLLAAIQQNNPNAAAIYMGTVHDLTRYYPNIELGKVVPADFAVTGRPWYTSAVQGNPKKPAGDTPVKPVWSSVYQDATGLGLVTTVAEPAFGPNGDLVGVVGLDVTLDEIKRNILASHFYKSGYSFLVDQQGHPILLSEQAYRDIAGPNAPALSPQDLLGIDLESAAANTGFAPVLYQMKRGEAGFSNLQANGKDYLVAYSSMPSTGWSLASVAPADEALQEVASLEKQLSTTSQSLAISRGLPVLLLVTIVLVALTLLSTNRLVDPLRKLAKTAERIGAGEWEAAHEGEGQQTGMPSDSSASQPDSPGTALSSAWERGDEISQLGATLSSMATQLQEAFNQQQQRVEERTRQLEQRTLQIQTASEIARDISVATDLDDLLQRAVELISQRFGYYNTGIFLVDESGEMAHLRAASGELGDRLRHENLRLRVGLQGIVGYVTRYGQSRLVVDVLADTSYHAEPLLPDTRSEAALPLRKGGPSGQLTTIGALDVQSTQPGAFDENDVIVLQILADQLAIAIENFRLVTRLQAALRESSQLYQQQVHLAWREVEQTGHTGYLYDRLDVRPLESLSVQTTGSLGPAPNRLIVPLSLREQVIGQIVIESDDPDRVWSQDEINILEAAATQASLSLENARLLEATRRRVLREQITSDITTRMRASLDIDTVLQTALKDIADKLGLARVEVQLHGAQPLAGSSSKTGAASPAASEAKQADAPAGAINLPAPAAGAPPALEKGNGSHE